MVKHMVPADLIFDELIENISRFSEYDNTIQLFFIGFKYLFNTDSNNNSLEVSIKIFPSCWEKKINLDAFSLYEHKYLIESTHTWWQSSLPVKKHKHCGNF